MGIDMLVVDEFHCLQGLYKNLFFHTKMTRIAGLPNTDSQRAFDMFVKVRDLLQRGGRFIGLTGTPVANTMAEAFTLQRYFAYDQLVEMGLSHFDSWAQMFADVVMMPEMTPDGSGFRVNTRLARFSNIPELSAMLSQFMILRRFKDVNGQVDRPNLYQGKPTAVKLPGSKTAERVREAAGKTSRSNPRRKCGSQGGQHAPDCRRWKEGGAGPAAGDPGHGGYCIVEDQHLRAEHCGHLPSHWKSEIRTDRILRPGYAEAGAPTMSDEKPS